MTATLQREHWNGQPTLLGDLFRVSKMRGDKDARWKAALIEKG